MIKQDIEQLLEEIKQAAKEGDYEKAHGKEDWILKLFVEHVTTHYKGEVASLARLVMTVDTIIYPRHCA